MDVSRLPRVGENLRRLQAELVARGLSYFLVPHADEFRLEYPPPSSERLAWASGFTGSAGFAVVGAARSALFVDGRYTQQARQQASEAWEQRDLVREPPARWLRSAVAPSDRVGFDPRLHTPADVKRIEEAVVAAGGELVAVDENPIDRLWEGRPAPPTGGTELYPESLAGQSWREKVQGVAARLREEGLDAHLVTDPTILMWLLNLRGSDTATVPLALGRAIVARDASVTLLMESQKLSAKVRANFLGNSPASGGVQLRLADPEALGPALAGMKGQRVLLAQGSASQWVVARLEAAGAKVVLGEDPCAVARACKPPEQVEGIRRAHLRDAVALIRFLDWLQREGGGGHDEWSVAQQLERLRAEGEGFRGLSFRTISASGPNSALPHYSVQRETARALRADEIYLVDSGGQYLEGTTDVTRVTILGDPTQEMRARYTQVLRGHIALSRARFPEGTTGAQLDALARQPLWWEGVDFDHGTGHGVGAFLSVHEGPHGISKRPNGVPLQPGMVVSNEPGYYKVGAFGIRIENLVVVGPLDPQPPGAERLTLGFDPLTLVPYERRLIDGAALTAAERQWVDEYHGLVRSRLSSRLEPYESAKAWMERATAPLEA